MQGLNRPSFKIRSFFKSLHFSLTCFFFSCFRKVPTVFTAFSRHPFLIYIVFTGYLQAPCNPLASSNYMVLSCFLQAPCFNLHGFYTILRGPLFIYVVFTHGLYLFLKGSFFIYMGFTFSLQAPRFIYMVFTCMSLTGSLFSLRWVLHVSHSSPFFSFSCFFTRFLQAPLFHLYGFYRVKNKTFPKFLQHSVELFPRISHALVKQFTSFLQREVL